HVGWVGAVGWGGDGKTVATGGTDKLIRLWDPAGMKLRALLQGHTAGVEGLAFTPNSSRLASAGGDGTVRLWDPATGQELAVLRGPTAAVRALAFSPDGKTLATVSGPGERGGRVRLW